MLGSQLFDVWINEDAAPAEATADLWEECLNQVVKCDMMLVLYNGNSGWAKEDGGIGICHAELQAGLSAAPAKLRMIRLPLAPLGSGVIRSRNERFRNYVEAHMPTTGAATFSGEEVIQRCCEALRDALGRMVRLGVREARRGRYHRGDALDWQRLDFAERSRRMKTATEEAFLDRQGTAVLSDGIVTVPFAGTPVVVVCHSVPDALSLPAAQAAVGQPFLFDHQHVPYLRQRRVGPIHVLACHQGATNAQARRLLGFADATIVQAPFGIYVADQIQKVQLVLFTQCRDPTAVRHGVQRFFDWLEQAAEARALAERARGRKRIVVAIAKEVSQVG